MSRHRKPTPTADQQPLRQAAGAICVGHYTLRVGTIQKQASFTAAAIAFIGSIVGIAAWWLPSSAAWMNKHGFAAWPLAGLFALLFAQAAYNWYRTRQALTALKSESEAQMAALRLEIRSPVPEDRRLYELFKQSLPADSQVLSWLRHAAGERIYHQSDIGALIHHIDRWRATDEHFIDAELDSAYQNFNQAAQEFLSYQSQYSHWAPQPMQLDDGDTVLLAYERDGKGSERAIQRGLGGRADAVIATYKTLHDLGSRLRL